MTRKYSLSRRDFKDPGSDTELGNYYFIRWWIQEMMMMFYLSWKRWKANNEGNRGEYRSWERREHPNDRMGLTPASYKYKWNHTGYLLLKNEGEIKVVEFCLLAWNDLLRLSMLYDETIWNESYVKIFLFFYQLMRISRLEFRNRITLVFKIRFTAIRYLYNSISNC